jgi:dTDP-4-amino-4,6-dideoxygalactose transaminase
MLRFSDKEVAAVAKLARSGKLFRYGKNSECERFERRWAKHLGVKYACMTSSGTAALSAALAGLGIGPGDEVIVPAATYMATPVAVLNVGAIPIIVDSDESLMMSPQAFEDAIGPRTRCVIPVHLWGLTCDMRSIMRIARKRKLLVVEDACQAVGGGYEGKMLGSIGHMGTFSFNYYKNMTCGEGGAVVTNNRRAFDRARCMVDCCEFYWHGRKQDFQPFASTGSRASEIEGAILNAQLPQLPGMLRAMRKQKKRILRATADTGLQSIINHSLDYECANHTGFLLPTEKQALAFRERCPCMIAGDTGRHIYTQWDVLLDRQGAHHRALDPFRLPQNRRCRKSYSKGMCKATLRIANRAVLIANHPDRSQVQTTKLINRIKRAAKAVL